MTPALKRRIHGLYPPVILRFYQHSGRIVKSTFPCRERFSHLIRHNNADACKFQAAIRLFFRFGMGIAGLRNDMVKRIALDKQSIPFPFCIIGRGNLSAPGKRFHHRPEGFFCKDRGEIRFCFREGHKARA